MASDSPMLAPHPMRGKRNEPAFLHYTLDVVAELIGRSAETVATVTTKTAKGLFQFEARDSKRNATITLPNYFG
jgi:TatD DNase family protein